MNERLEALRRDPAAATELAGILVREALETPISAFAAPEWVATQVATGLRAATHGDTFRVAARRRLDEALARVDGDTRTVRSLVPTPVDAPLRKLLSRPWSPDPALTLKMVDQGVFHDLLTAILKNALSRFGRKARSFDSQLGGLGKQAKAFGKGLLGGLSQRAGEGILGAVAEEVEAVFERRVEEFVEGATSEALRVGVTHLTDPGQAAAYGQLRVAILDVLLDATVAELGNEVRKLAPHEALDVVLGAAEALVADPQFVPSLTAKIAELQAEAGDGTLGAWLAEVGLREPWERGTAELLATHLQRTFASAAFGAWWTRWA